MCDCDCELSKYERWKRIKDEHAHELAEKIRKHADDPRVKPHLIDGEWTGLRMGANVIDPKKEG